MKFFIKYLSAIRPAILLLLLNSLALHAQTPPSREYQLKSAFLFNFIQFVEWPSTSFTADTEPFVIGVLGENPFQSFLEELVSGEKVNGRPVTVRYFKNAGEVKTCHILFINQAEIKKMGRLAEDSKTNSILTVSDAPGFLDYGGMIRLFIKDNKIKMQINPEASKAAGLVVSSKLLRLAEIYK